MSRAFVLLAVVAVGAVGAGLAWIRLAPSDPTRWHVDPLAAPPPGAGGVVLRPGSPDGAAPVWPVPATELLAAFDRHVRAVTPRLRVLAGSVREGRITYVVRSRLFGFPDYVTVAALPLGPGESTLAILSRLRFGRSDLGVNRARVQGWLRGFRPQP